MEDWRSLLPPGVVLVENIDSEKVWHVSHYSARCAGCRKPTDTGLLFCLWWRGEKHNRYCSGCWFKAYLAHERMMSESRVAYEQRVKAPVDQLPRSCAVCGEEKAASEFAEYVTGSRDKTCRACRREYAKGYKLRVVKSA